MRDAVLPVEDVWDTVLPMGFRSLQRVKSTVYEVALKAAGRAGWAVEKCDSISGVGDNNAAIRGSEEEELMKRAIMGVSAATAIALAPLCIPPAQAHAGDPCAGITNPAAHQACIGDFVKRREQTQCDASPNHGQLGQLCG
jgi:hypothetical protein